MKTFLVFFFDSRTTEPITEKGVKDSGYIIRGTKMFKLIPIPERRTAFKTSLTGRVIKQVPEC